MVAALAMLLRYSVTSRMACQGPVSCQRRDKWRERAGLVNLSGSVQRMEDSRSACLLANKVPYHRVLFFYSTTRRWGVSILQN